MFAKDLYPCKTACYDKNTAKQYALNKHLILANLHTKLNGGIWFRIQIKVSLQTNQYLK